MIYDTLSDNFELFMRHKLFILQTMEMLQIDRNEVNQIVNENQETDKVQRIRGSHFNLDLGRPGPQSPSGPSPDGDVAPTYGLPVTPLNPTSTSW